jgi:Mg2+ and Co2+ transporter CorA
LAEWGTATKEVWRLQPIVAEGHRKEEVKFAVAVGHQFRPSDNRIRMKSGTWLEALAYSRQQTAQNGLGLHDLAIEDAHSAHQRPKLEQYENCLFVVPRTAQLVGESQHVEFGETHIFVGLAFTA